MKKGLKILCAALSLTAIMSFSAFAAETKKEYRAEAEPIRTEMKVMEEQMDALRESNKDFMEHFKNIHQNKKETGELPVDKSVWKEAKTLRGKIKTIREENGDSQVKNLRAEAKAAAENKDFDTAILKLKEAEKEKEKRLEMLKEINSILTDVLATIRSHIIISIIQILFSSQESAEQDLLTPILSMASLSGNVSK